MFTVGKKYKGINTGIICTCVWANDKQATLTSDISDHAILVEHERSFSYYKEHIEPRVEYYNAYKYDGGRVEYGSPYKTEELARGASKNSKDFYGILKMTHYSDRVDVEFHLKRK